MSDFDAAKRLVEQLNGVVAGVVVETPGLEIRIDDIRLLLAELERVKAENHAEVDNLLADAIYQRERAEKVEAELAAERKVSFDMMGERDSARESLAAERERAERLEKALRDVLASRFAEDCQECGIGQGAAWAAAKELIHSAFSPGEEQPDLPLDRQVPPTDPAILMGWYRNDASFHNLVDLLASQRLEGARDAARQEERGAIRELAHSARTVIHRDFLIAWLDARSRGEEPQP